MTGIAIAVMAGDGIGPEVMESCLAVLERALELAGTPELTFTEHHAGAEAYRQTGTALSEQTVASVSAADAILFGAMGLPQIRYPDGTEIAPQLDLRARFELFAGVRPIRAMPGVAGPLRDARAENTDLVILRESTEGLFASRGKGTVTDDQVASDTMIISRRASERVARFAFLLARDRKARGGKGEVTIVDKSNVFRSMAFFRQVFDEVSDEYSDITARHAYVDAVALDLVRQPWTFDVIVTENMFGDILSDLGAALIGGMGMAPSADIGDDRAVFQPSHGSAPDIAGQGRANPTAMILSGAMMLDWLAHRKTEPSLAAAARSIEQAVTLVHGESRARTVDLGGSDGTAAMTAAIIDALAPGDAQGRRT